MDQLLNIFGLDLFDKLSLKFFIRLLIDIIGIILLVRVVYYPIYRKKDYFFTYFSFNVVIFIITYLLNKVELSMGAAFGLFAVFSMLRYRTEGISIKDMTYLFIVIALGLINSVSKASYFELALLNSMVILLAYCLDGSLLIRNEMTQVIHYEKIENVKLENQAALLEDLRNRTGLAIFKVSINNIDFVKDTAHVTIYFYK
jgi:hypothetical protein